jgi:hypothetical protein
MVERLVPRSRWRIALFCSLLALASMRCISDFVLTPDGGPPPPRYQLRFLAAPSRGAPGAPLEPRIRVAITDAEGHRADSIEGTATIRIAEGPPGVSLGGTTMAAIIRGEATFDSVTIDGVGEVRLAVFAPGLAPDTTSTFAVTWPPVDEIGLSPRSIQAAALGDTVRIIATLRDEDGRTLPAVPLTWTTTDPAVAGVTAGGLVTMLGNGEAVIQAEVQGVGATVRVEVRQKVRRVTVTPAELVLATNATAVVRAAAFDRNDSAIAWPFRFSWSSNRSSRVAVLPGTGDASTATLRRFRGGTTTVTATLEGATGSVTVR